MILRWLEARPFIGPPLALLARCIEQMNEKDGLEISGYIAFTAMLALFPFLVFLAALTSFIGETHTASSFINYLSIYMPKDVANTLTPAVLEVLARPRGDLITIGLLGTFWSAASGIDALRLALNRAYQTTETRSYFHRKLQSFMFVLGGAFVIFIISILIILWPFVWNVVTSFVPLLSLDEQWWHIGRYILGLILLTGALVLLHRWLPNHRLMWRRIILGAVLTTVFWLISATAFSYYLGKIAHYGITYGSLGGVIATLLFFYLTAVVFILGGEINATVWRDRHSIHKGTNPLK